MSKWRAITKVLGFKQPSAPENLPTVDQAIEISLGNQKLKLDAHEPAWNSLYPMTF